LNKKAQTKLIEQEQKIQVSEHNLGEFSQLLNEKDLVVQELVMKIQMKDEEIQSLLRGMKEEPQVQVNPIETIKSTFSQI
jgi:hypothetical protein